MGNLNGGETSRTEGVPIMNPVLDMMYLMSLGMEFEYMEQWYYDENGEIKNASESEGE